MHLLSPCPHGGMQNQNVTFNALIWQRATKETFSRLPIVELSTFLAVGIFNNGAKAILDVLGNLGIKPGCQTKKCLKKIDYDPSSPFRGKEL